MINRTWFIACVLLCISMISYTDAQWSNPIKSVISGVGTYFARQLPKTLTGPFGPDPTHPNLRFWFTPDTFEQDNVADNTPVETWRNVAQLGVINGVQTLYGDPEQPERLMQTTSSQKPLYKRGVLNGHGVVRFARSNTDGSTGQRLVMYQNSSATDKGFMMNPFANSFTMMMVVKTNQNVGDTGEMGIFSAGETENGATGEKGLHVFKTCSTCTQNGGSPPKCFQGKYASLSTLNALYGQSTEILTGSEAAMKNLCVLNSKQLLSEVNHVNRILTVRVTNSNSQATLEVFIDGLHASTQPPIQISQVTPPTIVQFMLGVKAFNNDTNLQYMSGDIAEVLVYNTSLTNLEADRIVSNSMTELTMETAITGVASGDAVIIANAHKVKLAGATNIYGIKAADEDDYYSYKRGMNIFFPTGRCEGKAARILSYNATSRCATIGGDLEVGDYDLQSVATLKDQWGFCSGTNCQDSEQNHKWLHNRNADHCLIINGNRTACVPEPGQRYLIARDYKYQNVRTSGYYYGANYISGGAFQEGPASGGSFVRIRGAYLFPNDMHIDGVASVTNVQLMNGKDAITNLKYLQVKIGGNVADACTLYNFPRGNDPAGTRSLTVYDYSAVDELPEIRCKVPSGVGNGNDLEVSWHGVAVTISNWFKYSKPIVRRVSPVSVSYSGGDKITIYGNNFGPQAAWATGSSHPGRIELYNRGYQSCSKVEYISDSELRCIVPALRPVNLNFDKSTRTLNVKVVVNVGNQASALDTAPALTYQKVPTYYSCAIAANDVCMSCCRGACMLDAIADSPTSSISSSCDTTCYRFCGILSSSRRLLEVLRQIMETRNSTRR
ncbi:hypothetical protein GUITHDRAFT_115740 [Guillardia theta CCMP2712]|uniref:IPT/TIG domain-containing protein n=1 Tax=Guillardia theta (strain CCMP2712) TaxID=905079 RepID=L1IPH8_GUITC|nr:hypothetical protein GUITHDRAFT_115740 [Guillardia theta CCMP2712]EKX38196.1 hypothetical protein GUITHDRAFT_115740 [Guillardia theta CCMP2712]|eukprot:XP_005825176.1 hypothetical protein GUITHDRAFT_115740 [Guillardia theta CCMP2712]